jgi:hypothetical protein
MKEKCQCEIEKKIIEFIYRNLVTPTRGHEWMEDEFTVDGSTDEPILRFESWLRDTGLPLVMERSHAEPRSVVVVEKTAESIKVKLLVRAKTALLNAIHLEEIESACLAQTRKRGERKPALRSAFHVEDTPIEEM